MVDEREDNLIEVGPREIARKQTWAGAIELCAEVAGYTLDKQAQGLVGIDQARWSRIKSGREGIKPAQLFQFMDGCRNNVPILWLAHQRGYDIGSMNFRETEMERQLREAREELERERLKNEALVEALRGAK